jgi:hypothetical protein
MDEELNSEAEIGRLVWVAENFFKMDSRSHHELSLFFLVTFPEHSPVLETEEINGIDEGDGNIVAVINRWHQLDMLNEVILVPPFLKAGLRNMPRTVEHVVNREK